MRHHVRVRLDLVEQALLFHPRNDRLARGFTAHTVHSQGLGQVGRRLDALKERIIVPQIQPRLGIEDTDLRQVVPLADLEVVEVMRRRDLHCARSLFRIGVVITDDRDATADQRQDRILADQMTDLLIARMHAIAVSPSIVSGRVVATVM